MSIHDYYLSKDRESSLLSIAREKKDMLDKAEKEMVSEFYPSQELLSCFPEGTVLITISFTLKKPYTSKDEDEFRLIRTNDKKLIKNPIVRDKFTGSPMIRPTSWKGHLRFAAEKMKMGEADSKVINRLFGAKDEEATSFLRKGRLYFFPTFFEKDSVKDIITPLSRESRTPVKGKSPISLEVIPAETKGELRILYFPYPRGNDYKDGEVEEDLMFLSKAIKAMLFTYGFSAKKTSGFGVVSEGMEVVIMPNKYENCFAVLLDNKNNSESGDGQRD